MCWGVGELVGCGFHRARAGSAPRAPAAAEIALERRESSSPECAPGCSAHLPRAPRGSERRSGGPRAQVAAIGQAGPGG